MRSAMASLGCLGGVSGLWPAGWAPAAPWPCDARVARGVLPVWARGGFSEQKPRAPHVLGRSGAIVAILFADPLFAPPSPKRSNKILWVSRLPVNASALRITARRMVGARSVGPSIARRV